MPNDNEICANCGREKTTKIKIGEGLYWCQHCGTVDAGSLGMFIPSDFVPASLLDKVRALCDCASNKGVLFYRRKAAADAVREALAEIDKGE